MKKTPLCRAIGKTAVALLDARGHEPEVCRQVEALVGSLDDTLSDERVLEELKALKAGGPTFGTIIVDNSSG